MTSLAVSFKLVSQLLLVHEIVVLVPSRLMFYLCYVIFYLGRDENGQMHVWH